MAKQSITGKSDIVGQKVLDIYKMNKDFVSSLIPHVKEIIRKRKKIEPIVSITRKSKSISKRSKSKSVGSSRHIIHFRRATPWNGFLNVQHSFGDICQAVRKFIQVDTIVLDLNYAHYMTIQQDLLALRNAFDGFIFVRDYWVDPYQIHEARANGADGIIFPWDLNDCYPFEEAKALCEELGMTIVPQATFHQDFTMILEKHQGQIAYSPVIPSVDKYRFVNHMGINEIAKKSNVDNMIFIDNYCDAKITKENIEKIPNFSKIALPDLILNSGKMAETIKIIGDIDESSGHEHEQDETWLLQVCMLAAPPVMVPYQNKGAAYKAFHMLKKSWDNFKNSDIDFRIQKPNPIFSLPEAYNGAIFSVTLEDIRSVNVFSYKMIHNLPIASPVEE